MSGQNKEKDPTGKRDLSLSRRDKLWVALAITGIIVGFALAVIFDI